MVAYISIAIIILLSGVIFYLNQNILKGKQIDNIFLFFVGVILIFFAGFRGAFTSDYSNYEYLFHYYNSFDLNGLISHRFGQELGYVMLNWLIGRITSNIVWVMFICSIITITLYFIEIKKNSVNLWLSVFLFVTIGQYYTSFNLMRQVIAAAITFRASSYLYDRKLGKYILFVLIATLFHKTALIMIPFYFLLNYKFNYKKLFLSLSLFLFIGLNIDIFIDLIGKYFYSHYIDGSYGMSGFGIKNIVLPFATFLYVLLFSSLMENKYDYKFNIWLNATIFYTFFSLLGLNVQMIERMSNFFAPYILLIIPQIIGNQKNKNLRILYYFIIIMVAISYNYTTLSGTGYDPYYFIWSK